METVDVDGLRIAFERKGEGPPLILLHGGLADGRVWRRQVDALSDEFTVIAWDAPGCGESDDPPETFRLPDYADCLAGFIGQIGTPRPHVLGLSFGGGLAIQFYGRHPSVPRSLILASAYAGWAGSLPREVVDERLSKGLKQSEMPPDEVVEGWLPTLFMPSTPVDAVEEYAAIMRDFHPAGVRVMLRAFAEADLRDVLAQIDVPTLLLYGDADQRSPADVAEKLHSEIRTSRLVMMPGVGHVLNVEAPEAFNSEVRRFLNTEG